MMRRLAIATLAAAALAAGPSAASGADLSYACSPPLPPTAAQCYAWNTVTPVRFVWLFSLADATPIGGDCTMVQMFSQDTSGRSVSCEIQSLTDPSTTKQTAVIRIDATPPTVTGMDAARPPDHDGWWNHPVDLKFSGTDATSGIAGCDVVTYSGPDGADAPISGACRDHAGNTASKSFALKYDATPPSVTDFAVRPGNRKAVLSWATSPDTVQTEVARTPGVAGAPTSTLYGGTANTFTDSAVVNGTTYHYTVIADDAAGNVASAALNAKPSALYAISPARSARLRKPPMLRWPPVSGAGYYNVQLFRGKHKILSAWPTVHHLRLHRTWRFHGRRHHLKAGHYRWFVWPGFGARAAHRYGPLVAHLGFYIDR